jgi:hypothetical protein
MHLSVSTFSVSIEEQKVTRKREKEDGESISLS